MRSYLTRNVFYRLLRNEPLVFKCPHRSQTAISQSHGLSLSSKRNFFGFSQKPPKQIKPSNIHMGLIKMRELTVMDKVQARPPPIEELLLAFRGYFNHKNNIPGSVVEDIAAAHVLRTFRHLRDTNIDGDGAGLSIKDLKTARSVMMTVPKINWDFHNAFAREVYTELERRNEQSAEKPELSLKNLIPLIKVLCHTECSMEARGLVEDVQVSNIPRSNSLDSSHITQSAGTRLLWVTVLAGFAREKNEQELLNTAKMAENSGITYHAEFHEIMTTFFASRNDIRQTKFWFGKLVQPEKKPSAKALSEILHFCLQNDESEWCKSVFRDLLETSPDKPTWDIIFQWAAGGLGKGVEEVERMMNIMTENSPENQSVIPDIETINGLVQTAMAKNNPYLAERYLALGLKSGIRPNANTFILQMNYRIDAGDLSGAQSAYEALQSEEVLNHDDLPVINKYLRALCADKSLHYEKISSIVSDLDEKNELLEADTVAALCILHLKRNDYDETLNTIQVHSYHLSLSDRAKIRDAFFAYCLDRNNSNISAWDSYTFIKDSFSETDTKIRTQLMNEFFDRKRGDMGFHVFGHMRQDIRPEIRPTSDIYTQCFEGIGRCADGESLDMVHNMMKMDSSIEPSTKLYNALMLAYSACDEPSKALDFWEDITISREGPTYNSIEIVFRVCEKKPFGDRPAKLIWNKMRRMEIEITQPVFNAYVGALAGQALIDEVKVLVEGMKAEFGYGPDMLTIGILYNASPNSKRDGIEEWTRANFPQVWEELMEKVGQTVIEHGDAQGDVVFNIVRPIKA